MSVEPFVRDEQEPPSARQPAVADGADPLIGREAELRRVHAFLSGLAEAGTALVVCGDPGVGKSALLAAASSRAAALGIRVLHATAMQFDAHTGFGALQQLLGAAVSEFDALGESHRDALKVALGHGPGPAPDQHTVSLALLALVTQLTRERPLLLVLEDIQWLDPTSAVALSFVAHRLTATRAGILASERPEAGGSFERAALADHVLRPLSDQAASALLAHHYPALAPRVRQRLIAAAQGNPLALLELPVSLTGSQRSAAQSLPDRLPMSRRLQEAFASRVDALPSPTRYLLLLAALDATGDLRLLRAAVAERCHLKHLGPAEHAQLIRIDEQTSRLTFRHPLTRAAVVERATSAQRRHAHLALARPLADQPERRAWHLGQAAADPDEVVASALEHAAGSMSRRGDGTGAIASLLRAADLSPDPVLRARRLAAAAYIGVSVTGALNEVPQLLDHARQAAPDRGSLVAAMAGSAYLLNGAGDIDTAHQLLRSAIARQSEPYDARQPELVEALHTLMLICFFGGRPELWEPVETALRTFAIEPSILSLTRAAFADPVHRAHPYLERLDRAIADLAYESDPVQIIRVGIASAYLDRLGRCREALHRVAEAGHRTESVALAINALFLLGNDALRTAQWDELDRVAHDGLALCQGYGYPTLAWVGKFLLACRAAIQGDYAATRALTDDMEQWAGPRRAGAVSRYAAHARALAALGRGDFEQAYQQAATVAPPGAFPEFAPHALWLLMELTESAVRTDRRADAQAHVAAAREAGLDRLSPRLRMVLLASAALCEEGRESNWFEQALAVPEAEQWPFDLARIHLYYGEHLRRAKATAEARRHLTIAADAFERLAAVPWTRRAAQELRATGSHREGGATAAGARLTPQQREIAKLAAGGLSNREIGERLFLSPRTVSTHLYQSFPKLGVSSRAGLRDALDELDQA